MTGPMTGPITGAAPIGPEISYRKALQDTLRAELVRDENVFLMGEEIGVFEGSYKITAGLLEDFGPKRVRDTPICEEGFVGAAIGAEMRGLRQVEESMSNNLSMMS
jgi:pyruvate dehydrogenase E1 component beta subunit